ncbi:MULTISPECIES: sigma-54 interaction domain-containing protein [unclassified Peribacillus]|uniref:sigma-54 interaction domain-containing protein n=1 Tax=unclassified Peribacillus TaxID=2675266 RepID=UPI001912EDAC|nr:MULTISPECIES: sigma 54-interacting transcriptional regulator [unclassified Peribacillus]MBK5446636.1 sigma 54-interacting transcriptional regulator [Peribacillus sp. TH24]MBK5458645.1 sigma 54-interacting transcriptional regulator [Peribacillus sp. TH27]MBK5480550.1 sigma 54-interacting transcriptional regulator [Peribacillus sp. TH16]MBK5502057.1 sigma 54-interacting transcriptional regulator [Peribacillus sp. TH14]WMX57962.1 sigma 54-interacting transcriptional regulator [Peribacillus sp.
MNHVKQDSQINLLKEWIFPALVVDSEYRIRDWSSYLNDRIGQNGKKLLTEQFEEWQFLDNNRLAAARLHDKRYLFIFLTQLDNGDILYVGSETQFLDNLLVDAHETEKLNRALDAIIENSYDGIYITDQNGITLYTNSAIERITGIPKEYYIGKSVDQLIKRGILNTSVTHKVVKLRRTVSVVQDNFAGKETLITGSPVFNEEGEIEQVVTNIRDLSDLNELMHELTKVNELNNQYKQEIEKLRKITSQDGVVFVSDKMKMIYEIAERISDIDATVLILGETGVGKDVLARNIYNRSIRSKKGDFVKINCGAIPADLLESELFGYEGGAFTGANQKGKPGMFEVAESGILFLDEVGELPLQLQVKLLRALQEREIQRIGGTKPKKIDVRIIAATNRNLLEMVKVGEFREDLYYRLNVIPITIPPLRERREDILALTDLFLTKANEQYKFSKEIDSRLKEYFFQYDWPGNVRELNNIVERLVVLTNNQLLSLSDLPEEYQQVNQNHSNLKGTLTLKEAVERAEKEILTKAAQTYQTTYEIAEALDSSQATIVRKLKKYQLKVSEKDR